jgi:hypothetical protein
LSGLAKRWAVRTYAPPNDFGGINRWYDDEGYELEPGSGRRLTDEEIDAQWVRWQDDELDKFKAQDIPIPAGGFADPDTWEPPPPEEETVDRSGMTEEDILNDIESHGRDATAQEYGVPKEWLSSIRSDRQLARTILDMHGKPWPARSSSSSDVTAG